MTVIDRSGQPLSQEASGPLPQGERRTLYLYLVPFILFPILLFLISLVVIPTQWFRERAGNSYLANIGYATKLHNMQCDVLIYGDSSAMMGVDPAIVEAKTGLKTCNIAEFEAITLVDGTEMVDRFLQNNPRPRYLIFLYVPGDLTLVNWNSISTFEAITYNLKEDPNFKTFAFMVTHPKEAFGWSELGLRMLAMHFHSKPYPPEVLHQREADKGLFRYVESVAKSCDHWQKDAPPDIEWVQSLRSRYSVPGTKVLVDATPTAMCDANLSYYQEHLNSLVDNSPYSAIPLSAFQDNGHLHANTLGVSLISTMVADQVNAEKSKSERDPVLGGGR